MELQVVEVLAELEALFTAEEKMYPTLSPEELSRRIMSEFILAVGPETGQFLNMLLKTQGGVRVLDVGTGVGYSTVCLAEAVRVNGGRVTTFTWGNIRRSQPCCD